MKEFSVEELERIKLRCLSELNTDKHPLWEQALSNLATSANYLRLLIMNSREDQSNLSQPDTGQSPS